MSAGLMSPYSRRVGSRKMKNEYPPADIVFTSPMLRCIETARIIYPGKKLIEIPDFRECDFGEFEMKNYEELNGRADYQAWIDGGGKDPFPGGESMDMVRRRSMRGFYRAMELAYSGDDGSVPYGIRSVYGTCEFCGVRRSWRNDHVDSQCDLWR